jgi:hypothetical protein
MPRGHHVLKCVPSGVMAPERLRRIGHDSPAITLKVYSHMFSNTDSRAADIMEATFAKVGGTEIRTDLLARRWQSI